MSHKETIRELLCQHAGIRKIAATVVRDCQERYEHWQFAAVHRLRGMTGESIDTCQTIVSEMSDI